MAELPTHTSDYLHRSIDQLRSMNERGVLSSLSHLTTADLRNAQLVHDYKQFNINEFRQNVERLDYSIKNGLVGVGLDRSAAAVVNLQHQQQQQQMAAEQQQQQAHAHEQQQQQQAHEQQQQQQQQHHHQQQLQQQQQQQVQQQVVKQSYSAPNSPPTPTMSEGIEQKYDPNAGELQQHTKQRNHHQQSSPDGREAKPYKCTQCPKTFANSSYLSQHTRIHLGIKPYRCEICQRKFTQLSHLQQHIRTHTGDKPYKCRHAGCPKAFSQLSNLQSHSRCHQTDKPFKCNSCYKCFTDEMSLMEHIPKHKDSKHLKTHICNLCGKSYTQETYLQKHLQKHAEKAEKLQRNAASVNTTGTSAPTTPQNVGLGLNLQRQVVMNAAVVGDSPYWAKVGADGVNAATLAEAIQQQQQQHQQQQQQAAQNGYNFALQQQQQQQQQELLQHHQRVINGGSGGGDSAGSGSTPNHSQSPNDEGEDLVMRQTPQHHLQQQATSVISGNSPATNYDVKTTSAFTPINSAPPHLNALAQQRPPAAAYQIYQQNAAAAAAAFPSQLISLHQIRNYAHQPGAAAAAGLLAGDHLLGLSVVAGGAGKDKTQ